MTPLTSKQQELLDYLRLCERAPSFEEMKNALGLKSKSGVHRLVNALCERGYLRRLPNRARAIAVMPEPFLPDAALLASVQINDLAREARRRGLMLGRTYRDAQGTRRFEEIAA